MKKLVGLSLVCALWVSSAFAGPFEGTKKIIFHDNKGGTLVFGTIDFMPRGDQIGFKIH